MVTSLFCGPIPFCGLAPPSRAGAAACSTESCAPNSLALPTSLKARTWLAFPGALPPPPPFSCGKRQATTGTCNKCSEGGRLRSDRRAACVPRGVNTALLYPAVFCVVLEERAASRLHLHNCDRGRWVNQCAGRAMAHVPPWPHFTWISGRPAICGHSICVARSLELGHLLPQRSLRLRIQGSAWEGLRHYVVCDARAAPCSLAHALALRPALPMLVARRHTLGDAEADDAEGRIFEVRANDKILSVHVIVSPCGVPGRKAVLLPNGIRFIEER